VKYKLGVIAALKAFRSTKPWRGTLAERKAKFRVIHAELNRIYNRNVVLNLDAVCEPEADLGNGWCNGQTIALVGKLSVVTLLHEWGHALYGHSEAKAIRYSIGLYKRAFPRSAARHLTTIRPYGSHLVTRKGN
jgi:hypothetical protein